MADKATKKQDEDDGSSDEELLPKNEGNNMRREEKKGATPSDADEDKSSDEESSDDDSASGARGKGAKSPDQLLSPAELTEKTERAALREGMEKWKVRRLETSLDLSGRAFLEEELGLVGLALKYASSKLVVDAAQASGGASVSSATAANMPPSQWYQFTSVSLSRCFLGSDDLIRLLGLAPLSANKQLTHLDLSSTKVGDAGCLALVSSLVGNVTLSHLDLRNCSEITLKGALLLLATVLPPPTNEQDLAIESTLTPEELLLNGPGSSGKIKDIELYKSYVPASGIKFVAAEEPVRGNSRGGVAASPAATGGGVKLPEIEGAVEVSRGHSISEPVQSPTSSGGKRNAFRKSVGKALVGLGVFGSKKSAADPATKNAEDGRTGTQLPAATLLNPRDSEENVLKMLETLDVKVDSEKHSSESTSKKEVTGNKSPKSPMSTRSVGIVRTVGTPPTSDGKTEKTKKMRGLFQTAVLLGGGTAKPIGGGSVNSITSEVTAKAESARESTRDSSVAGASARQADSEPPATHSGRPSLAGRDVHMLAAAALKEVDDDYDDTAGGVALDFLGNLGITDEISTQRLGVRPTMKPLAPALKKSIKNLATSKEEKDDSAGSSEASGVLLDEGSGNDSAVANDSKAGEGGGEQQPKIRAGWSTVKGQKSALGEGGKSKSFLLSFQDLVGQAKGFDPILDSKVALCPQVEVLNGIKFQEILGNKALRELNFSGLGLGDVEAYLIRHLLLRCQAVEKLDLSNNKFKTSSMQLMKGAIAKLTLLTSFNASNNMLYSSSGDSLAGIITACKLLVSVNLANTELTNGGYEPISVRVLKEAKEKIKPDMSAVMKLSVALQTHKKLVDFDLSGNGASQYLEGIISDRLKVNKSMLHDKGSFLGFVDVKYDLNPRKINGAPNPYALATHRTSLGVEYDFFSRERKPLTAFLVKDAATTPSAEPDKNALDDIAGASLDAMSKLANSFSLASIPPISSMPSFGDLLSGGDSSYNVLAGAESPESKSNSPTTLGTRKLKKTHKPQTRGRASAGISDVWDDSAVSFTKMVIPHEEIVKPKTPLYIHEVRKQTFGALSKNRCGTCIGCFALTRCENQGAYTLADETAALIRNGFFDKEGDGSLGNAMRLLRARKEPVKALDKHTVGAEKRNGGKRRSSVVGFRKF